MLMRSKTSLTLAPTPHHHSEKASPSLQVKLRMGQLKTSTLTFNSPRKFLPNERKRKTAQKHTWSSSACRRCSAAAIEARFSSPMRTAYMFSSPMLGAHRFFVPGACACCIYAVRSVRAWDGFDFSIATFFHKMQVETCGSPLDIAYTWTY